MTERRAAPFLWELRPYFRQVAGLLVLGSISGILMNVAVVLPAIFLGRAINAVVAYQEGRVSSGSVGRAALAFVLATALTEVPRIGKRWWLGVARTRIEANVRSDALRGVLTWPMDRLAALSVGGVMARVIGDVRTLGLGVGEVVVETWDTLLLSVSLSVTMFVYAPGLTAFALAPVPVALVLAKAAGWRVALRTERARQSDADLTTVLHEQLSAFRLLRLSGRSEAAIARVQALTDRQAAAELDAIRLDAGLAALYTAMLSAGVVFVIVLGGRQVASGAMSVGGLVAFLQLFSHFVWRAPRIPHMTNRVQAAGAAYVRLRPLLAPPLPINDELSWSSLRVTHVAGIEATPVQPPAGRRAPAALSFRAVTFSYPAAPRLALCNLDLEIEPGTIVAVTGPVGSGKSALARLAAGIYPPDEGDVLLDGAHVAELESSQRQRIGYLGQEPHLFSGTVVENILLALDHHRIDDSDPNLRRAVELAALEPDLVAMPDGPRTEIGELGVRVSGGQRQRIALARSLAAAGSVPRLLVLDDPFSAVDVRTEVSIMANLRTAVAREATILLCSHRLGGFAHADQVIVLNHGRIEERGAHGELLDAGGLYARIYRAQARVHESVPVRTA